MTAASWTLSALSIIGGILNAFGKIAGFYIWIVANMGWIVYAVFAHQWAQIPMWVVYTATSALGIIIWRRKSIGK